MTPDAPRFAVVVDKGPRRVVVFQSRLDNAAADLLVVQRARLGCAARVVRALEGDVPAMRRRRKGKPATTATKATCPAGT